MSWIVTMNDGEQNTNIGNSNVHRIQVSTSGGLVPFLKPSPFNTGDGEWLIWDDGSRPQTLLPCRSICVSVPRQNQIHIADGPPADAPSHAQYAERQWRGSGTDHARLSVYNPSQEVPVTPKHWSATTETWPPYEILHLWTQVGDNQCNAINEKGGSFDL